MKQFRFKSIAILTAVLMISTAAYARNDQVRLPIRDALNAPEAQEVLNPDIKLVFGGGGGKVLKAGLSSRQTANAVGKSDEVACNRAFLNTLLQFQKRAVEMGGRRVINIRTYYGNQPLVSSSQFFCHAGSMMARVTMKADIAQ